MLKIKPLSEKEILERSVEIIKKYLPDAKIYLFGSRAKGTAKYNSDFDIAIERKDKIPLFVLSEIREELENLPTLKSFDLIDLSRTSKDFQETIRRTGVVLYDGRNS